MAIEPRQGASGTISEAPGGQFSAKTSGAIDIEGSIVARGGKINPAWLSWSPQKAIEAMDAANVATAVLSLTSPGVWFGENEPARKGGSPPAWSMASTTPTASASS